MASAKIFLMLGGALLAIGGLAFLLPELSGGGKRIASTVTPPANAASVERSPGDELSLVDPTPALELRTPAELRVFKRRCDGAERPDEPWLRQLALHAADPLVAGQAIQALGRLGLFGNDAAYVALLDDPRARVKHEVVRALGRSGDHELAPRLESLLRNRDTTTRGLAIQALGNLPGAEAREMLLTYERGGAPDETERAFLRAALAPEPIRIGQRNGDGDSRSPVEGREKL